MIRGRGNRAFTEENRPRRQARTTRFNRKKKKEAAKHQLKQVNSRTIISAGIVIGLAGAVIGFALLQKGGQRKIVQRQKELEDGLGKVTEPMTSSIRNFNPVLPPKPMERVGQRGPVAM